MPFKRLKALLDNEKERSAPDTDMAAAVLLYEVARADQVIDPREQASLRELLLRLPEVQPDEVDALIDRAAAHTETAVSLHEYLDVLNQRLDADGKRRLMHMIWRVAWADGQVDAEEEHRCRKLADMLFIPHSVFIQEKLAVAAEHETGQEPGQDPGQKTGSAEAEGKER